MIAVSGRTASHISPHINSLYFQFVFFFLYCRTAKEQTREQQRQSVCVYDVRVFKLPIDVCALRRTANYESGTQKGII